MDKILSDLPIEGIKDIRVARGGDVNESYKVYADDIYFLLLQKGADESFYAGEIAGLKLFEEIGITAPRVIASGAVDGDAYLLLSFLDEGAYGSQKELADLVAKMHYTKSPSGKFGFDLPYRGSDSTFTNEWRDSWAEVFIEQRMDVLAEQLVKKGLWADDDLRKYEKARQIMIEELKNHKSEPSLLHGDLWGGNYMFLKDERPALFDPSPLYGDREFDMGITTVFGGFSREFYERYKTIYPLDEGYDLRFEFYRLYLFMVHLVKFGRSYENAVERCMDIIINY